MNEISEIGMIPRRILLATDLTSRCDRALDRALQLSRAWHAELHIVHAVEALPLSVPVSVDPSEYLARHSNARNDALRMIQRHIGDDEFGAKLHVEEKVSPAAAILEAAEREACDLIIVGEARERLIGPVLESTIEQVVRKSPVSVLAVRDRLRRPYQHLLVGTDFTDEAQQALISAANLFRLAPITLMHAFTVPYATLLNAPSDNRDAAAGYMEKLCAQVAATPLDEDRKALIRATVANGPPGAMLRLYVLEKGADLTVIGAHARGVLFDAFLGNSRRIFDAIPGDILMVRALRKSPRSAIEE